jgi:hypothetical protein
LQSTVGKITPFLGCLPPQTPDFQRNRDSRPFFDAGICLNQDQETGQIDCLAQIEVAMDSPTWWMFHAHETIWSSILSGISYQEWVAWIGDCTELN